MLAVIKVSTTESDNALLVLSEILSPLTKRLLVIVGLLMDPKASAWARLVHPYPNRTTVPAVDEGKRKQE